MEQDVALNDASRDPTSSSIVSHFCLMAKASKVSPAFNPNICHDDDVGDNVDEDNDEESDNTASFKNKGEMIFKDLHKNNISRSNFMEILSIAIEEENKELKAQVTTLKKDLEKSHEGMSTLNNILCGKKSPTDKGGIGFNSNKKKKSKSNNKKGQEQIKNSSKIVCFKCKIERHHVRSCPLKKKSRCHEQQGKRPQVQLHAQPQFEERPLPKKTQAYGLKVEK
ncbi:hypothetical protein D1007_33651 [Hordeum vulgare]|nr:hypothetical protein D1007_33651 [Hordeum vulgare]